jgi:hypothetical protein
MENRIATVPAAPAPLYRARVQEFSGQNLISRRWFYTWEAETSVDYIVRPHLRRQRERERERERLSEKRDRWSFLRNISPN